MPASWNDLSNEIRKIIIEYVVADTTVTFVPRHAATRGARKKDEAKAQEPAHFPLLLVSKQFLTYAELNDAVLKNATIKQQNGRDLMALDVRFGKGGIENIKTLHIAADYLALLPTALSSIPVKIRRRLTRLQKLTVSTKPSIVRGSTSWYLQDIVDVAQGRRPKWPLVYSQHKVDRKTNDIKHGLRYIIRNLLICFWGRSQNRLVEFLVETSEEPYERLIQFEMQGRTRAGTEITKELAEYSSATRCCRFVKRPSVVMPQRICDFMVALHPLLATINEVELDKYYKS